jgi:hypothetical protein
VVLSIMKYCQTNMYIFNLNIGYFNFLSLGRYVCWGTSCPRGYHTPNSQGSIYVIFNKTIFQFYLLVQKQQTIQNCESMIVLHISMQGQIQDFKLRWAHLKTIASKRKTLRVYHQLNNLNSILQK